MTPIEQFYNAYNKLSEKSSWVNDPEAPQCFPEELVLVPDVHTASAKYLYEINDALSKMNNEGLKKNLENMIETLYVHTS